MALATLLLASPVHALAGHCGALAVEADAALAARWPELPERVRQAFRGRTDIDACAQVALALHQGAIVVKVTLTDGRSTSRTVMRREDVLSTVEALLLVPPAPPAPPGPPSSPSTRERQPLPELSMTVQVGSRAPPPSAQVAVSTPAPANRPSALRLELSLATSARVGNGETTLGLGVLSFAELHDALAGFEAGVDGYRPVRGGAMAGAIELGALGGWRFERGARALDLYGGPALLMPWGSQRAAAHAAPGALDGTVDTSPPAVPNGPMPRARLGVRLDFRADATLRPWIALDGDVGGSRNVTWEGGRVPSWGVGLSLGAMVGTL